MTISRLLVLTALVAAGLALGRLAFGLGVFVLAFVPLAAFILHKRGKNRRLSRWVYWPLLITCLVPAYAVTIGPYIASLYVFWVPAGHWYREGFVIYKPTYFFWSSPLLRPYGLRFESTWQELGLWVHHSWTTIEVDQALAIADEYVAARAMALEDCHVFRRDPEEIGEGWYFACGVERASSVHDLQVPKMANGVPGFIVSRHTGDVRVVTWDERDALIMDGFLRP